jgi:DNA (cytosine-5)-methyltransferase 1
MENVAALVSQKFIRLFNAWQLELERYGYRNFAKVLNAKDYGVPQNRERIFMVSVLDEQARYEFPDPMPLQLRLKDVLEKEVPDKYYLKCETIEGIMPKETEPLNEYEDGVARTIKAQYMQTSRANFIRHDGLAATGVVTPVEPIVLGWVRDEKGNVVKRPPVEVANTVTSGKRDNTQNYVIEPINTDADGCARTINCHYNDMNEESVMSKPGDGYGYVRTAIRDDYRIRKLTERECFRLMDVPEEYIDRIQAAGISRSQQYKMAGNSIVVACMYHLFRKLWIDTQIKTLTLF